MAIHEVGEHEGRSYFSMDLIEGRPLAAVLQEGKLPPARATLAEDTGRSRPYHAHQRGTLHRDLKPNNVLISADGQPHPPGLRAGAAHRGRGAELTRTGGRGGESELHAAGA